MSRLALIIAIFLLAHVYCFKQAIHEANTIEVLRSMNFDTSAATFIAAANWRTDVREIYSQAAHFDSNNFVAGSELLIAKKERVIAYTKKYAWSSGVSGQEQTWEELGSALHTLQDFYARSTWVDAGHTEPHEDLGQFALIDPNPSDTPCEDDYSTLTDSALESDYLYSGYFPDCPSNGLTFELPEGRCKRGTTPGSLSSDSCANGINKDDAGRPNFPQAISTANKATRQYIELIMSQLNSTQQRWLKGLSLNESTTVTRNGVDMIFVLDTTGSMSGEINQVQVAIGDLISSSRQPNRYIIVPYNDPYVPEPFITVDPAAARSYVNSLGASGGGDCPELGWTGLLKGLTAAVDGSNAFFFSDADSRDTDLAGEVLALVQSKHISIDFLLTGSCSGGVSNVDKLYYQASTQSGGQLFVVAKGELNKALVLLQGATIENKTVIYSTLGNLLIEGVYGLAGCTNGYSKNISLLMDSTSANFTISMSFGASSYQAIVTTPQGVVLDNTNARISMASSGVIFQAPNSYSGVYNLWVCGSSSYSLGVTTSSSMSFESFQLSTLTGRYGDSLVPISGQPLLGASYPFLVKFYGDVRLNTLVFHVLFVNGTVYGQLPFRLYYQQSGVSFFVGNVVVPTVNFNVRVQGLTTAGVAFQRFYTSALSPQPFQFTFTGHPIQQIQNTKVSYLNYTLVNVGLAGYIKISATASNANVNLAYLIGGIGGTPTTATYNQYVEANANFTVVYSISTTLADATSFKVVLTASNADMSSFNSYAVAITVAGCPGEPMCGGVGYCDTAAEPPRCVCPFGMGGDDCGQQAQCSGPNPCNGHGQCDLFVSPPVCVCERNWYGDNCEDHSGGLSGGAIFGIILAVLVFCFGGAIVAIIILKVAAPATYNTVIASHVPFLAAAPVGGAAAASGAASGSNIPMQANEAPPPPPSDTNVSDFNQDQQGFGNNDGQQDFTGPNDNQGPNQQSSNMGY